MKVSKESLIAGLVVSIFLNVSFVLMEIEETTSYQSMASYAIQLDPPLEATHYGAYNLACKHVSPIFIKPIPESKMLLIREPWGINETTLMITYYGHHGEVERSWRYEVTYQLDEEVRLG